MKFPKIGIEGTVQEIKDFCENFGFDYNKFLNFPSKIKLIWVIVPIVSFFVISILLWTWGSLPQVIQRILIILDLLLALWVTSSVHLRFENKFITTWSAIISLIIICVCSGLFGFDEAIRALLDKI